MRKILVVIDMQNDFINGALGTPEAVAIVPSVVAKIRQYDPADVYATRDTHTEDYLNTQEGKSLPVPHCIRGTAGWELHPEIAGLIPEDHLFDKPSFGSPDLAHFLARHCSGQEVTIDLIGLCTDICVVSNALLLKAALPEVPLSVDASCCAGVTPQTHRAALTTMKSCQVEITNENG
ncbi:MAG: cysteine hydrolase [Clostridia bacterium]|nr:cysteine hydrolase [Clostridia bacterium]